MNVYQFMSDSPWLTFFLAAILAQALVAIIVNLPNRIMRHANIRKHGYPPAHCDADGDFKPDKKETK